MSALREQARVELLLTLRRGESLLLTFGIPLLLLVFFSTVDVLPTDTEDAVTTLAPAVLALAVMSTAMVNLAISTGFERSYGVLKRLGSTPLGRPRLLAAKTAAMLVVLTSQVALIVTVSLLLGWDPRWAIGTAVAGSLLAAIGFAGLGLLMAGTLRAEVTLAAANGLYLVLLLAGGILVPLAELPEPVRTAAELLPSAALTELLQGALTPGGSVPGRSWLVLLAWAVAAPVAAVRTFRWE